MVGRPQRALVTGGTGFIGSSIVQRLVGLGWDVAITGSTAEQRLPDFRGKRLPSDLFGMDWDAVGDVDVLFHEAAINDTTLTDRAKMFHANVTAPQELFRRAVEHGCRRIVYASSTAVYGDVPAPYREDGPTHPLNVYAESKLALDALAMAFAREHPDVTVVGLRYCNVYGPGEQHKGKRASMIYQLAQQMRRGRPRLFAHGEQKRDYIYTEDVVRANMLAAAARNSCAVNCGSGTATTFNDLVALLNDVLGTSWEPEYIDNPYAAAYQSHTECDMTFAREALGFVPRVDIRSGLKAYFDSGQLVSAQP